MRHSAICPAVSILILTACLAPFAQSTKSFWNSPDAYLGQKRPSDVPEIFAPGMLADSGTFVMGRTAFSLDGREFYYTQGDSWNSLEHARIKMIRYAGRRWEKPVTISEQFVSPTLSMDNNTLYVRRGNMHNVWQSHRTADGWSAATPFLDKPYGLYDFMPTKSGRFYIGSNPDEEDVKNGSTLVFSTLTLSSDGVASVKSLGRPLNRAGFNGDLFVAPDESYLIISTNETKTFESELYISFRNSDSTWAAPVSLGSKINDGLAHRWGQYVTPDGKYLFYTKGTSEKDCAVYWVRFDKLLAKLRSNGS